MPSGTWHAALKKNDENYFLNKLLSLKKNSFDKIKIILFLSLNLPIIPIKEAPFYYLRAVQVSSPSKRCYLAFDHLQFSLACLKTHPTTLFEKFYLESFLVTSSFSFISHSSSEPRQRRVWREGGRLRPPTVKSQSLWCKISVFSRTKTSLYISSLSYLLSQLNIFNASLKVHEPALKQPVSWQSFCKHV